MRTEKDYLGERSIAEDALYGIHALRARENFPDSTPFPVEWYKAAGLVKQSYYITYKAFSEAALKRYKSVPVNLIPSEHINALEKAAAEVARGQHFEHFIVPGISGGAGTSINMNINEIIANRALTILGHQTGSYHIIDPTDHANIFQSTNDLIPSALRIAAMRQLQSLEKSINGLRSAIEDKEKKYRDVGRTAYTQMQEALPSSWGRLLSSYNDALSRDWWRVSKSLERIKQLNIGGGAIGTSLAVPRYFVMETISCLQNLSQLPLARSENLSDTTSNQDSIVEVHAILKAHAVNLEKMANDLRLLASDIHKGSLEIPQRQTGSSIMPAKINPVISEYTISATHKIYANDMLISSLAAQGCLELNAYIPIIGLALLESIRLLSTINDSLNEKLIKGMIIHKQSSWEAMIDSPSISTALLPLLGYQKAGELAKYMKINKTDIFTANKKLQMIDEEKLKELLKTENLLKGGYSLNELANDE